MLQKRNHKIHGLTWVKSQPIFKIRSPLKKVATKPVYHFPHTLMGMLQHFKSLNFRIIQNTTILCLTKKWNVSYHSALEVFTIMRYISTFYLLTYLHCWVNIASTKCSFKFVIVVHSRLWLTRCWMTPHGDVDRVEVAAVRWPQIRPSESDCCMIDCRVCIFPGFATCLWTFKQCDNMFKTWSLF